MSCHYSCSACSANYYYDLCTSCPSTRQLVNTVCQCSSGYYQIQQSQCQLSSSANQFESTLISIAQITYYVAIGIHLVTIILTLNRLLSVKIKKFIDTLQVVALIGYYRFPQAQLASRSLKIMNAFNFDYFSNLICSTQSPPYGCYIFQNLIPIGFTLVLFFFLFFTSYILAVIINAANYKNQGIVYIRNGKQQTQASNKSLTLQIYWQSIAPSLLLLYLDHTAIQTSIAISRVAIVNYWGLLVMLPFIILIVVVGRMQFKIINDSAQTTLAYRARHGLLYLYDQEYHFNYIDHIFQEQNIAKNGNLRKPFYPQSNLMIIEILFKILVGTSTIVFYKYEPYLFAYCCMFLLLVYLLMMKTFFFYQRSQLFIYLMTWTACTFSLAVFYLSTFFTYYVFFLTVCLLSLICAYHIVTILSWRSEKQGEMLRKTYELEQKKSRVNVDDSEDDLVLSNQQESHMISESQVVNINVKQPNRTSSQLIAPQNKINENKQQVLVSNRQSSQRSNRLSNRLSSKGQNRLSSNNVRGAKMSRISQKRNQQQQSQAIFQNSKPKTKERPNINVFDSPVSEI